VACYGIRIDDVAQLGFSLPLQVAEPPANRLYRPLARLRRPKLQEKAIDLSPGVGDSPLGLLESLTVNLLGLGPRRGAARLGLAARLGRLGSLAGKNLALYSEALLLALQTIQQQP
jgi:hypothetical protein